MKKILFSLSLFLMLFALPAHASEKFKDFMFKGMPGCEIIRQEKGFGKHEVWSKDEYGSTVRTSYEGNLVVTAYVYKGPEESKPSELQIVRTYQNSVKKLDATILYEENRMFHASFVRNDKKYYIEVRAWTGEYNVYVLEVATMDDDLEILDVETILHKLDKEGFIALYINFDTGKATIKPESKEVIEEVVAALKSKPQLKVKLEGHTDNVGNAESNKKLSDDRAKAVMDAIVAGGVDASRLSAEGFGLEKPIADNGTEAGRAKNRRVELVKVQ